MLRLGNLETSFVKLKAVQLINLATCVFRKFFLQYLSVVDRLLGNYRWYDFQYQLFIGKVVRVLLL